MTRTVKEFLKELKNKRQLFIYGAGKMGRLVFDFLKNNGVSVTAFAVTIQNQGRKLDDVPIYSLDDILNNFWSVETTFILAVTKIHQASMEEELRKRKISSYIMLSEMLFYELEREKQKVTARKEETKKEPRTSTENMIGYLTPGYLNTDYAEKRLIINKMKAVSYIPIPKETANISYFADEYEDELEAYKQVVEACYCPKEYRPVVDLIHTFNTVCDTDLPWCASFETAMPRVWPKTEEEKAYFLQLVECMKRPNCKTLYAFCQNAYEIQKQHLSTYISSEVVNILMKKTKVLHPPQEVLITEEEFEKKHNTEKIQFIFIGRFFFFKGGREIIKALSKFEDKYDFGLTLISPMLYNDYFTKTTYEEMLKWKKVIYEKEWIDYYDELPNEEVLEKCKEATIGLLPSVADTYGYSVLEMQAAGCPVVTTNIRAFPEINNDDCGWICKIPIDEFRCCAERDNSVWSEILQRELERCFSDIFNHLGVVREKGLLALKRIQEMHDPFNYQKELRNNLS